MAWVLMLVALVVAVATALFLNYVDGSQGSGGGGADLLHRGMTPQPQGVAVRQARFAPAEEGQAKAAGYLPPTSGAAPQLAVFGPPPICPSLILPNTEARFLIPMENLLRPNPGVLDILGTSGRKLLHAAVEDSPGGQKMLSLASVGCEGDPRARICTTPSEVMQIYGKRQRFYGTLEPRAGVGGALVKCDGYHVMTIDSVDPTGLQLTASTPEGRMLASAGRSGAPGGASGAGMPGRGGPDHWRLQVKPGADAVLVASCMLAILLLQPTSTGTVTPSLPSASPRASTRSMAPSARSQPPTDRVLPPRPSIAGGALPQDDRYPVS